MKSMPATLLILAIAFIAIPSLGSEEQEAKEAYERAMKVYAVDVPASVQLLQRAAKMGSADAMVRLGYIYQTADSPRYKDAIQWYKRAVDAGNAAAIYEIGSMYQVGSRGVKPDMDTAISWYEKGVSNHSVKCTVALSQIYASSSDIEYHDGAKAMKFAMSLVKVDPRNPDYMDLLAAACARNLNFDQAMKAASQAVNLSPLDEATERRARREAYSQGIPHPPIASDAWILEAAEKENLWAVMKLAEISGDELGDDYDPIMARHWYEIAAENNHPEAMLELGYMYFHGIGGEVDLRKAFWCFSETAEDGLTQAYAPLARMYVGGKGTGQDFGKAEEWYKKAVDEGLRQYNQQLNIIRDHVRSKNRPSPDELFEEAQQMASKNWVNKRGETESYSRKTDDILMRYWLAAEQDHLEAMKELADMFFYGKRYFVRKGELDKNTGGLGNNYSKALDYYRLLDRRGIEVEEMEACKELYFVELKERRERQRKKQMDAKRAAEKAARKKS